MTPARRREVAQSLIEDHELTVSQACHCAGLHQSMCTTNGAVRFRELVYPHLES